jgi:hypothetical protein
MTKKMTIELTNEEAKEYAAAAATIQEMGMPFEADLIMKISISSITKRQSPVIVSEFLKSLKTLANAKKKPAVKA